MGDELWACTICLACQEHCPVFITPMEKIVEMRRGLVLMESRFPLEVQLVLKNLENNSKPLGSGPGAASGLGQKDRNAHQPDAHRANHADKGQLRWDCLSLLPYDGPGWN